LLTALKDHIERLEYGICCKNLFRKVPTVPFGSTVAECTSCNVVLRVKKTRRCRVATLHVGTFRARETVLYCPKCNRQYMSEDLLRLRPSRSRLGYDVLVYVGKAMFLRCRNEQEIREELKEKDVVISAREVSYLAVKFIAYLSLAHRDGREELKSLLRSRGGYILHLDATCEADSPHLMSGLDGISEIVLENVKLPTEKAERIVPFLRKIKALYGDPLAVVNDMSKAISNAVATVFPRVPDFICHYHFLADTGKDLFGKENDKIRARLRKHGIQGKLRSRVREFNKVIEANPALVTSVVESLKQGSLQAATLLELMPVAAAYSLAAWVLAAKKHNLRHGFPFDRPYLVFYERLTVAYGLLRQLNSRILRGEKRDNKPYVKLLRDFIDTMEDTALRNATTHMQQKVTVFDKLREAMRIALPEDKSGLKDPAKSTEDIRTIEKGVTEFLAWLSNQKALSAQNDYTKMRSQIEHYWDRLFCDPIVVETPSGTMRIQPQRTNNIIERRYWLCKRIFRKKSGAKLLGRSMTAMVANTPLVTNLGNPEYMNIILDGKTTLEERFAEIDIQMVRQELERQQRRSERIPSEIRKIIRMPEFPQALAAAFAT